MDKKEKQDLSTTDKLKRKYDEMKVQANLMEKDIKKKLGGDREK